VIIRPVPWHDVETGMTVVAPDGRAVVAPSSWPSDAVAAVVFVDELEAAEAMRAAGFTWEIISIEGASS
jgi:hypothetical protein